MKIIVKEKKKMPVKVGDVFFGDFDSNGGQYILSKIPVGLGCFKAFLVGIETGKGWHYGVDVKDSSNISDDELKEILYSGYNKWKIKVNGEFVSFVFDNE